LRATILGRLTDADRAIDKERIAAQLLDSQLEGQRVRSDGFSKRRAMDFPSTRRRA